MKKIIFLLILSSGFKGYSQNAIPIPDTLSGPVYNLNIHPDSVQFLPGTKTFTNAFNQYSYLGPTLILHKGENVTMNVLNSLDDTTTVHWHGLHVPAMADGGPHTFFLSGSTWSPQFTVNNHASTFWYHPHTHMKTGQQAMRGAAGMIIVRDSIEANLNLPRQYGIDDFPIVVQSQQMDANNQILWRGMHDSLLLVNGTQNPMLSIPAQVVRLRLLNASQERNFNFGFTGNRTFKVIGNDGGLLNAPVDVTRIRLSPGERAEVLLDLTGMTGQQFYLMSYASEFGAGIQGGTPMPGMDTSMYSPINGIDFNILQLNVSTQTNNPVTTIPASLVSIIPWDQSNFNEFRNIIISAQSMMSMDGPFYFNGQLFDMNRIDYRIPLNNVEIWSLSNQSMVAHPFHLHGVQFFVLDRDGVTVQSFEAGPKDVVMVAPNETVRFITKFEDYADSTMPYMYHCHILMHEDDGMMGQYVVLPNTSGVQENGNQNLFSLYPIPVTDELNLKFSFSASGTISVHDLMGRIIMSDSIQNGQRNLILNTSMWKDGIYFISLEWNGKIETQKLIVQHL
ncbi:MAG: multicopper oxidase domain-containing protein [Bacteroidetes bacterium]|nr:multicopper oxidase domain-containing protein [Bacteroidota bacterium]MBP6401586.1 multicopper oxidase domain-containing protein [Bacteroidia bacterium]MBP6648125.1 multicopper oxidase domain-containing protein [Bacteroidia bacterium]